PKASDRRRRTGRESTVLCERRAHGRVCLIRRERSRVTDVTRRARAGVLRHGPGRGEELTGSIRHRSAYTSSSPAMRWLQRVLLTDDRKGWRERARESIVDLNDGIVSAAGIAEGFAAAGASTRALVFAGATVVLTGGFAAAAGCYAEERTEWEMHHRMVDAERASIETDPAGEFEELVAAYEAKGLESGLARQVAAALTARDPVAA